MVVGCLHVRTEIPVRRLARTGAAVGIRDTRCDITQMAAATGLQRAGGIYFLHLLRDRSSTGSRKMMTVPSAPMHL
jgi:hypothetical protein